MSRRTLTFRYVDVPPMLGPALVVGWPKFITAGVRDLLAQTALTVTGYFRPRPDPVIECVLRTAFTDLDRELAEILGDRTPRGIRDLPKSSGNQDVGYFRPLGAGNTRHLAPF
jgi:hypothetical protein